jgi:hypothetical protein
MTKPLRDVRADDISRAWYVHLGTVLGVFMGALVGLLFGGVWILVSAAAGGYFVRKVILLILEGSSALVAGAVMPNRPAEGVGYSHIEALEMRGDVPGALAAWEAAVAENPDALQARISGAELYTRKAGNHARDAQLYRDVQHHPKAPAETRLYVTQRLIDLYLGPLDDNGRALVELRRLATNWPDSPEGKGALQAIARIKGL